MKILDYGYTLSIAPLGFKRLVLYKESNKYIDDMLNNISKDFAMHYPNFELTQYYLICIALYKDNNIVITKDWPPFLKIYKNLEYKIYDQITFKSFNKI